MAALAGVAHCHPHNAYIGLQNSLQQEWAFVQRVIPGIGMAFQAVEYELRGTFLLDLFQGLRYGIPRRGITGMPVKQSRIDLPDPTQTAGGKWTASYVITGHLVTALHGTA